MKSITKTRLMIIAPQLLLGGAETLVKDVFLNIDRSRFEVRLCIFDCGGNTSIYSELTQKKDMVVLDKANCGLFSFMAKLFREIKFFQPDVIDVWTWMTLYGRVAALLAGYSRIVPTINSDVFKLLGGPPALARLALPGIIFIERLFAHLDAGRIGVSEAVRVNISKAMKIPQNRVSAVYNGVDTDFFHPMRPDLEFKKLLDIPAKAKVVAIVARLAEVKNHKMFLRMVRNVCRVRADVYFLVAGPDWSCDYGERNGEGKISKNIDVLKKLTEDYGITKQLLFLGASRNIRQILSITDIFVMTSKNEGLNNAVLEALASGKPVVATAVGGMKESLVDGECGYYVASDDDKAMAERVLQLLDDDTKMKSFSEAARKRVLDKFTLRAMVDQREKIYKQAAIGTWSWLNLLRTGFAFTPRQDSDIQ